MIDPADIALEMARTEREALAKIRKKIAAQQLGELWIGLPEVDPHFSRVIFPNSTQTW
jgi:hypothetical protein